MSPVDCMPLLMYAGFAAAVVPLLVVALVGVVVRAFFRWILAGEEVLSDAQDVPR